MIKRVKSWFKKRPVLNTDKEIEEWLKTLFESANRNYRASSDALDTRHTDVV